MADATLGTAVLRTSLDASGLKAGLTQARGETDRAVRDIDQRLTNIGSGLSRVGQRMSLFITAPLVAAGTGIVKLSQDFEKSMNRVQALSGATGESLGRLRDQARQLGAETQFSASEAADAMSFLAMAGFNVDQIYRSMPDTLNLAAAAQLDMGSAADIVSNIMTGFGLATSELGGAVDVLTKAFISSNTDLTMLGQGMKFVGPIASGLGVSFEETTAALGLLSNAGIQAGSAGTGLRRILGTLASEADKLGIATTDSTGALRPLADLLDELNERGLTTAEALEIFGDRGGPAMQALLSQGGQALRQFTQQLEDAGGTAQAVAETQMQGLHGMIKELQSAGEELALSLGDAGLLTAAKNLVTGLTGLVRKFNELPPAAKTTTLVIAGVATAAGPLLLAVGTLITNIPKLIAGWQLLRAAMLPFLGPVGILAGAVAGYIALNEAMNAGRAERAQASADFQNLIQTMGAYRDQLVITGEEERQQLIASLERRREALIRVAQMNEAMIRQMESEVIAFANMPWWQQLFNFGATNVTLDALEKAEADLRAVRRELDAIDTQIGQVRTMEITPNVTVPDPIEVGDDYDSFGIPTDGSTREVEVEVVVSDPAAAAKRWVERLEAELRFGMKGPSEVIDLLSPRVEELRGEAASALAEFGIDSEAYRDTVAKLDVVEGALDRIAGKSTVRLSLEPTAQVAEARPLGITPTATADLTGLRSVADIERDLAEARARVRAAATTEARVEAQAVVFMLEEELKRVTTGISLAIEPVARVLGEARQLAIEPTAGLPGARPLAITPIATVGDFETIESIEADLRAAREAVRTAATAEARREAQLVVMELERELERVLGPITPRALAISPTASVLPEPEPRQLGIEPVVQIDGMDPAEWVRAQEDAAAAQRQAGFDFAQAVIGAGQGFVGAIEAFQAGNIGGGIAGLGGAVGGLFSGLGQLGGAFAGLGPWGAIIGAGAGLLGGLVNLFGGGNRDAREATRAAGAAARSVPAVELNLVINQDLHVQSLTDPASRGAISGLLDETVRRLEAAITQNIVPRIQALEAQAA